MNDLQDLKSWWILPRSMRLPPPSLPGEESDGIGQAKGSICPGHFIPAKSKHWNKILNRKGPLPYPAEMPITHDEQWDMSWKVENKRNLGLSVKAAAPVAEAAGVTVNADAAAAFQKSVANYLNFDKLDTYMVLPYDSYIADSLEDPGVAAHVKASTSALGAWEVYMISGIVVARGATMGREVAQARQVRAGAGAGAAQVAEASGRGELATEQSASVSVGRMSDFVWAIQLARVHKGIGRRSWQWETLWDKKSSGSTFAVHGLAEARKQFEEARAASTDRSLANASVFGLEAGFNVFIVPDEEANHEDSGGGTAELEDGTDKTEVVTHSSQSTTFSASIKAYSSIYPPALCLNRLLTSLLKCFL